MDFYPRSPPQFNHRSDKPASRRVLPSAQLVKRIPSIAAVMTPFPFSIPARADVSEARAMMLEQEIQHLPVMDRGTLVGLLWERDIRVAGELQSDGIPVGRVCNRSPYIVDLADRLDHVVAEMANRRVAAALVLRQGKLAGILTTTDVCRLLVETLRADHHVPDDGDAA